MISFGSSSNGFDDFKCHDLAGPYEVDGRWFAEVGDVPALDSVMIDAGHRAGVAPPRESPCQGQVDSGGYADVLSGSGVGLAGTMPTPHKSVPVVRRGERAERSRRAGCPPSPPGRDSIGVPPMIAVGLTGRMPIPPNKFYWSTPCKPGVAFGYLDTSNWWAVYIDSSDGKARIIKRVNDGTITTVATDTNALSLTNNTWYTAKVVVEYQTSWPYANVLSLWVDADGDADFSDETQLLYAGVTGAVGYCGVFRYTAATNVAQFDDVKIGSDNSSPKDGDFDDAGDEIAIDDNFNSAAITLSYDNNGNLTDDGIFKFVYDAWNRLVKAKHRSASNAATIATYAYDGAMRRVSQILANGGPEATLGDGGNRTSHYYFGSPSSLRGSVASWLLEERNGSSQLVRAYLNGAQPGDLLWVELNGDVTIGDDTSPDNTATGEGSESPADKRYFLHQDRGRAIATITEYDTGGTNNGSVAERWSRRPGGVQIVLTGDSGSGELNSVRRRSPIVNFDYGFADDQVETRRSTRMWQQVAALNHGNATGAVTPAVGVAARPGHRPGLGRTATLQTQSAQTATHNHASARRYNNMARLVAGSSGPSSIGTTVVVDDDDWDWIPDWIECAFSCWDCWGAYTCTLKCGTYCSTGDGYKRCLRNCNLSDDECIAYCHPPGGGYGPNGGAGWRSCISGCINGCKPADADLEDCADCIQCLLELALP